MTQTTLYGALANAQAQFPTIEKNAWNPHLKTHYADLAEVIEKVTPVLHANGLLLHHFTERSATGVTLVGTKLVHEESSQGIDISFPIPVDTLKAQELGSWITYLRRYGICALLGVVADVDDDAQGISGKKAPKQEKPGPIPAKTAIDAIEVKPLTKELIDALVEKFGVTKEQYALLGKEKAFILARANLSCSTREDWYNFFNSLNLSGTSKVVSKVIGELPVEATEAP